MTETPAAFERVSGALSRAYRIERELGRGGMATVYLAQDLKHHRPVAIKVLHPELAAALGHERFLREVEIAARLQHPNILTLIDSGEAGGFLYYVMPFVDGASVRGRLAREHELPVPDVVRIMREVADGLSEAHAHGVVHRDIKPDNVLLRGQHAVITDFGVAKAVSEATGVHALTSVGVTLGTPTYMAPEQAGGDPAVDHRADIYALGVMAYEMLTGAPPFTGDTPQSVLAAHMTRQPEPIASRRAEVPAPLAAIVMRCLEKNPTDRWQSVSDLLAQLDAMSTPVAACFRFPPRRCARLVLGGHPTASSSRCSSPSSRSSVWRDTRSVPAVRRPGRSHASSTEGRRPPVREPRRA
jgi:serine/threonine-protein kinase